MKCVLENIIVNFEERGHGFPFILFHGWNNDHRSWMGPMEPVFEGRDGWRRIYVDLPGMGETPGEEWIGNQDMVLDILVDFIDAVIPGERFAVAGHSYGGYLARGVVRRRMNDMDGLMLNVPTVWLSDDAVVPGPITLVRDPELLDELERDHGTDFREQFERSAVVQSREFVENMLEFSVPGRRLADASYLARLAENYTYTFDVDDISEPFPAPALVMTGRQDSAVGFHDHLRIIENYPRGTWAILDRAGHTLQYEQPVLFGALVSEWMDRVEEYRRLTQS